jgi:hypothetical protein
MKNEDREFSGAAEAAMLKLTLAKRRVAPCFQNRPTPSGGAEHSNRWGSKGLRRVASLFTIDGWIALLTRETPSEESEGYALPVCR